MTTTSTLRADVAATDPRAPIGGVTGCPVRTGVLVTVGALLWAPATVLLTDASELGMASVLGGIAALVFQTAMLAVVRLEYRTGAMGSGRIARGFYRAQSVVLTGAMLSTVLDALAVMHGTALWTIADVCWPLSMFGMLGLGIRVAVAGRWRGAMRWWALVAQSWFAFLPLMMVPAFGWVGSAHVVVGYAVFGVFIARSRSLVAGGVDAPAAP